MKKCLLFVKLLIKSHIIVKTFSDRQSEFCSWLYFEPFLQMNTNEWNGLRYAEFSYLEINRNFVK